MPSEADWLSLRVSEKKSDASGCGKPAVFITVPKKIVRLATRRNRLKRLLREALRTGAPLKGGEKVYHFRVMRSPEKPSLEMTKQTLRKLL